MGSIKGHKPPGQTNGLNATRRVPIWRRGELGGRIACARCNVIGAAALFVTMTAIAKVAPGT